MDNYLVMLRATISTEMVVPAKSEQEAVDHAQRVFETVHGSRVEMILGEVIQSPLPPLAGE